MVIGEVALGSSVIGETVDAYLNVDTICLYKWSDKIGHHTVDDVNSRAFRTRAIFAHKLLRSGITSNLYKEACRIFNTPSLEEAGLGHCLGQEGLKKRPRRRAKGSEAKETLIGQQWELNPSSSKNSDPCYRGIKSALLDLGCVPQCRLIRCCCSYGYEHIAL